MAKTKKTVTVKQPAETKNVPSTRAKRQLSQDSQKSQDSQISRSKKYTKAECDTLDSLCTEYYGIITKNSSRDTDRSAKDKAWQLIKARFDNILQSQDLYVRHFSQSQSSETVKPTETN